MNLKLSPDKTKCTQLTPHTAKYNCNLELQINKTKLPIMSTHPKIFGVTFYSKVKYNIHIQNTAPNSHMLLHIVKTLKATTWGKQKNTLLATCKARMRPRLKYASTSWVPPASDTNMQCCKLRKTQRYGLLQDVLETPTV